MYIKHAMLIIGRLIELAIKCFNLSELGLPKHAHLATDSG